MAYQGVNRFSNAVALLGSGRVLALRQVADALIETGFVTGSRQGTPNPSRVILSGMNAVKAFPRAES